MTDKQKLQSLFEAALKSPVEPTGALKRAFPTSTSTSASPVRSQPAQPAQQAVASVSAQPGNTI